MTQITLRNIEKTYTKNTVIKDLNLEVQSGEFLVLLGPSGCGKSTLLRMIAGLESATAGDILIGGRHANKLEPRERGCAMVFQNYALYPHMTVAQNIGYALKVSGMARVERDRRIGDVAKVLGLNDFLNRKPAQLSGGQRQRVAMGRAMIREPKVFLYDEPLSNLDARLRVAMRVEIRKLHQRLGTTTLFVTHDQIEAMTLADRIVVMNKGVIEQVGTPSEIYSKPASAYVAGFVGSPGMNLVEGELDAASGSIRFQDGQSLRIGRGWRISTNSRKVKLGFRAENVRVKTHGPGLTLDYQFSEELGPSRLLHTTLGCDTVVVAHPDSQSFKPGDNIMAEINAKLLHIFDCDSGKRIESAEVVDTDALKRTLSLSA